MQSTLARRSSTKGLFAFMSPCGARINAKWSTARSGMPPSGTDMGVPIQHLSLAVKLKHGFDVLSLGLEVVDPVN
jgi:hypothetical protein